MALLSRVRRFARRHEMWRPETRVVAAMSGGSDSVGMLLLLHDLHRANELRLHGVAHFNHLIRHEADDDERFCRELADRLGVPFASARIDVPALARAEKRSVEMAARMARRRFLDETLRASGGDVVATAHTQDDQAETVLLRLMRGAGARGMGGIAPRRDRRIRPVLCATRLDLRRELDSRGQAWREDASNADLANVRNRVRHQLLPYLEEHFNPSARKALARAADAARADDNLLERMAAAASVAVIERAGDTVSIDADALRLLPEAIQRRVVRHALAHAQARAVTDADVQAVMARMEHFRRKVVLVPRATEPFSLVLPVPGEVRTRAGWVIEAKPGDHPQARPGTPDVAQIDAAVARGPLIVRNRRAGDRIRPVGLGGTKKLQDLLVDKKVARHERDDVPIVTDRDERIIWVAGHVLGEEFRVTERTKAVIILKLRRI
jgi:tRNA(Ile)-lysidine synthase